MHMDKVGNIPVLTEHAFTLLEMIWMNSNEYSQNYVQDSGGKWHSTINFYTAYQRVGKI